MNKRAFWMMATLALGLLFGATEAYCGNMWIGSTDRACQASDGGECVQYGNTYEQKVVVEYAENVCQANEGGDCWQASNHRSYRHCERNGYGSMTCWN